jgi:hypothetical protein
MRVTKGYEGYKGYWVCDRTELGSLRRFSTPISMFRPGDRKKAGKYRRVNHFRVYNRKKGGNYMQVKCQYVKKNVCTCFLTPHTYIHTYIIHTYTHTLIHTYTQTHAPPPNPGTSAAACTANAKSHLTCQTVTLSVTQSCQTVTHSVLSDCHTFRHSVLSVCKTFSTVTLSDC